MIFFFNNNNIFLDFIPNCIIRPLLSKSKLHSTLYCYVSQNTNDIFFIMKTYYIKFFTIKNSHVKDVFKF